MDYEALIKAICVDLVSDSEGLIIREMSVEDEKRRLFVVMTDEADVARLIGKGGKVIRSIREIINLAAKLHNEYVDIQVENFDTK